MIFRRRHLSPRPVLVLFLSLLFSRLVSGQVTEASLKGVVADAAGRVVPASSIVATDEGTNQTRTAAADDNGSFLLAGLSPGTYTVTVSAAGFKTYERRHLKLSVGQTTEINIVMEVGEVQETVQVNAGESAIPVSTEGRLSDTFVQREIATLPLAQRDIFLLPKLSAGATAIPGAASSTKLTNSPVITVNGNRYRGNNYVLDGAMNTNPNNTGEPAIVPSLKSGHI
jgi:hypothetical protein